MGGALRRQDARGGGGRHRRGARAARRAGADLVRRRLPRPTDVSARARVGAAAGVRRGGRGLGVPVRADPRPRRPARRARRAHRTAAGTPARRRRAAHHERLDGGDGARGQGVSRPRRRRRRRGADVPRRDHVVPELRSRGRRRPARRARPRRRRARAAARRRAAAEARLHDPRSPEPRGRQPDRRTARAARRARAPPRLRDPRGCRLPRARVRRHGAAEPVEHRPGARRADRDDVEDAVSRRPARLGARTGTGAAQLVAAKQNTDQCAAALGQRLFEEYVRRGWIDEQLALSRALYRRKAGLMLDALERTMPPAHTGRSRRAASSRGSRCPTAATRRCSRSVQSSTASGSSRARSSSRTDAVPTTCGSRSASSTRR